MLNEGNRPRGAVFLDRDGVINEDRHDYVKNLDELKVYPYAPDAIKRLNDAGIEVYVISNQQAIAKGLMAEADLQAISDEIVRQVEAVGGRISGFYYCKHLAAEDCACRKPKAGLFHMAAEEHGIDLATSVYIGDYERDVVAGRAAGCRTILVLTGELAPGDIARLSVQPDYVARNLAEAVDTIVAGA